VKILSVRQPWAWLIINGLKDVENRDWSTHLRGPLLIHAGLQFESDAMEGILSNLDATDRQRFPLEKSAFQRGGIVGIVNIVDVVTESQSKWFEGKYGWCLENARPLPFICAVLSDCLTSRLRWLNACNGHVMILLCNVYSDLLNAGQVILFPLNLTL